MSWFAYAPGHSKGGTFDLLQAFSAHNVNVGAKETPKVEYEGILGKFGKTMDKMKKALKGGALNALNKFFENINIFSPIYEIMNAWIEILAMAFMPIIEKLIPIFVELTPLVVAFASFLSKIIGFFLEGDFGAIFDEIKKAVQWIKDGWDSFVAWFREHIINPIKKFFIGLIEAVVWVLNKVIEGVNFLIPGTKYDIPKISI